MNQTTLIIIFYAQIMMLLRMMKVEEKGEVGTKEDDSKSTQSEVKIKQATVTLEKVTLTQLTNYLRSVEFGQYNLQVSSFSLFIFHYISLFLFYTC